MTHVARTLRTVTGIALAPDIDSLDLSNRFRLPRTPQSQALSRIPQTVALGFEQAMTATTIGQLHTRLSLMRSEHLGFAYEGATMASTITDLARPGRSRWTVQVMSGPGSAHLFLNYIGIGFAMARLPRAAWPNVLPPLPASSYHPALSWLAVDGCGFDWAFFDPARWITRQEVPDPYPWLGEDPAFFPHVIDQGIGRALWFVAAGDLPTVTGLVTSFPTHRHLDLWSGVGLAATFAGGVHNGDLRQIRGQARLEAGIGAALAAKARHTAGLVPEHTAVAAARLTGLNVEHLVQVVDSFDPTVRETGTPVYRAWRDHIRSALSDSASDRRPDSVPA